jgi:uncharacterized protein
MQGHPSTRLEPRALTGGRLADTEAPMRVGLVSDTHGLFDPRLRELFAGCDLILHAGDIVTPPALEALAAIAPVRAVRGNNDLGPAFETLPEIAAVALGEVWAVVVHQLGSRARVAPPVRRAVDEHRARVVVFGHSHRPVATLEHGLLLVNPGSAGPRRFSLPRSAGILELQGRLAEVWLHDLATPRLSALRPPLRVELGATLP